MGKLKVENPNYMYIMCHRDHVKILIQSSSQALSIISNCYTLIKLDLAKHMLQYLPPDSLPLCVINAEEWLINNFEPPGLYCAILIGFSNHWLLQVMQ